MDKKTKLLNMVPILMLYAEETMRLYSLYGNIINLEQKKEIAENIHKYRYYAEELSENITQLRLFEEL